jgi:hypothetical protein
VPKQHASKRDIAVENVVFHRAYEVEDDGYDEDTLEHDVQTCETMGEALGVRDEWQGLAHEV